MIYTNNLTPPSWDKSGEKRMHMPKEMAAKYKGSMPSMDQAVQAKDGNWALVPYPNGKAPARGQYATAAEAVAASDCLITINNATPAPKRTRFPGVRSSAAPQPYRDRPNSSITGQLTKAELEAPVQRVQLKRKP